MTVKLSLSSAVERALVAEAIAKGISADALISGLVSQVIPPDRYDGSGPAAVALNGASFGGQARISSMSFGRRPRMIITTPRPSLEDVIASTGITPEEVREVEESLKPFLQKWGPLPGLKKERGRRAPARKQADRSVVEPQVDQT